MEHNGTEPKKVAIYGATSAIARETARSFATAGAELLLVGRNSQALQESREDLLAHGASRVELITSDLGQLDQLPDLVTQSWKAFGGEIDQVLLAQGSLPRQEECQQDTALAMAEFHNNATAPIALCNMLALRFEKQGRGSLAVITSVAADRGRQSNYLYGSAKAALATYVDGLHVRLSKKGIKVLNIKPGFVSTPMTAHLKQGLLFAKPEAVGQAIYQAMINRKEGTIYLPKFWRIIMFVVRHVPEPLFRRFSL